MVRSGHAEELLLRARKAAGTQNVRESVRDLTLHALRGRLLTPGHIAAVARTVAEGIESCVLPPALPVLETNRGAWAGLEDALGQALHAVELATREFAEGRTFIENAERLRVRAEISRMECLLAERWKHRRQVPSSLSTPIAALRALLDQGMAVEIAQECEDVESLPAEPTDGGEVLALLASGVLLGLSEKGQSSAGPPGG